MMSLNDGAGLDPPVEINLDLHDPCRGHERSHPWFFTRRGDPHLWVPLYGAEGVAGTGAAINDYWMVGATQINDTDLHGVGASVDYLAGHADYPDPNDFLAAGKARFDADGGLVGNWLRRSGIRQ